MTVKSLSDITGAEYDWLATDRDGHVAFFSTAGGGFAPTAFLINTDAYDNLIELLLQMKAHTNSKFAPNLESQYINTWKLMAERGVFAFDSDPHGGPYRLVAAPEVPITTSVLSLDAVRTLQQIFFSELCFVNLSLEEKLYVDRMLA